MNAFKKFLFSSFFFSLVFLIGCTEGALPMPTASPSEAPSATATALPSTATPNTASTATAEPMSTVSAVVQQAALSGDRAEFVSETYPDNSVLETGESFTKTFELRNAGSRVLEHGLCFGAG